MRVLFELQIEDEFNGWDEGAIFKFDNGNVYIQDEYKYNYYYEYRPLATVYSKDGQMYMKVDGLSESVRIRPLENYFESKIAGEFKGWEGSTEFKLTNGQIWKQTQYDYHYHYAYMPNVMIYNDGYSVKLKVEGVDKIISVTKIK